MASWDPYPSKRFVWSGDRNVAIIVVQSLRFLSRLDVDGVECVEQVGGFQEVVVDGEDVGMQGELIKDPGFASKSVQPLSPVAFERVPPIQSGVSQALDFSLRLLNLIGCKGVLDYDVPMLKDMVY